MFRDDATIQMMDKFADGLAHDLNNILLPIATITEVVMDELPKDSDIWQNLNKVLSAAKQGGELAEKIKSISVPDTKYFHQFDLKAAVSDALDCLKLDTPSNVTIKSGLQDVGSILGDEQKIFEMLAMLGSNASDAIGDDDGFIEISLQSQNLSAVSEQRLKPGQYAKLSIKNSGGEINSAIVPVILNPYFSTKSAGLGTGLSLSIVHSIILAHGGEISVASEAGVSTTFDLYFPMLDGHAP